MKLSIVTTLYRSAPYIAEFCRRSEAAARLFAGNDYEIVLVNDGSPDDSLELAIGVAKTNPHIVVVDLSRNFGHHKAMMTGLEHACGDLVFLVDSDLEEEPEWLAAFKHEMDKTNCEVVYGVQETRKGRFFERWSGALYYTTFNWLSNIDHPRNVVTARLMSRRYVNALTQFKERETVISCLWVITGFHQRPISVRKHTRSTTTYTLPRKIAHAVNAITSFSEVPLKLIFYFGLAIFVASVIYAVYLVFNRLAQSSPVDGWTSVMVSIWMLGGMIISFIGVIGIYLAKVFSETKQRPYTIVRSIYGKRS